MISSPVPVMHRLRGAATFGAEFIRANRSTGAILPSGARLATALTRHVRQPPEPHAAGGRAFLEVGPGTGAVTRYITPCMGPLDRLDLVEANPRLAQHLEELLGGDPSLADRTRLWVSPVEELELEPYDAIVAGLPFANFDPELVEVIFTRLLGALKPGGKLSFFGYTGATVVRHLTRSSSMARTQDVLRDIIVRHQVSRELVTWNVPPARVHHLSATTPS
ncbi:class I SAM-dependent methyltransferase [Nonomuraea sp. NPDC050556]|uniref:class I SAM-dependent methyltransferase n=1 Tax=Nonomuraea sp. NPDC050556 TaxID=3364369 RepID=UPI0037992D27